VRAFSWDAWDQFNAPKRGLGARERKKGEEITRAYYEAGEGRLFADLAVDRDLGLMPLVRRSVLVVVVVLVLEFWGAE